MTRTAIALCSIAMLLSLSVVAPAASGDVSRDVRVDFDVDEVVLEEDAGRVRLTANNTGAETLFITFQHDLPGDGPISAYFTIDLARVDPGREVTSALKISRDVDLEGTVEERVRVRIEWGRELTTVNGSQALKSVEGSWERGFRVGDEPLPTYGPWPYIILLIAVAVVVAFIMYPPWREREKEREREDG